MTNELLHSIKEVHTGRRIQKIIELNIKYIYNKTKRFIKWQKK